MNEVTTEADIQRLIGEQESIRLEFKGPEDFKEWSTNKSKIAEDLSKQVSAFANTYGGQIVIGVRETIETPRRAVSILGVENGKPPIETLQRLVESNLRPRLEGIRFATISLSDSPGRVVYVITVPEGQTAYQASDKKYYGRSEFESVALDDQLIRYKMVRGRISQALMRVPAVSVDLAADDYAQRVAKLQALERQQAEADELVLIPKQQRELLAAPMRGHDVYFVVPEIVNIGVRTIRECTLRMSLTGVDGNALIGEPPRAVRGDAILLNLEAANKEVVFDRPGSQVALHSVQKLFPGQACPFPGAEVQLHLPCGSDIGAPLLHWTLYLDDSPACSGVIELAGPLSTAIPVTREGAL